MKKLYSLFVFSLLTIAATQAQDLQFFINSPSGIAGQYEVGSPAAGFGGGKPAGGWRVAGWVARHGGSCGSRSLPVGSTDPAAGVRLETPQCWSRAGWLNPLSVFRQPLILESRSHRRLPCRLWLVLPCDRLPLPEPLPSADRGGLWACRTAALGCQLP